MHYMEGQTNLEIAKNLDISRFRVARLLERARSSGLVRITIESPVLLDQAMSSALRSRFDLAEALVYPAPDHELDEIAVGLLSAGVGRLAARYLAEILKDGDRLGVTWGNALASVAHGLGGLDWFPRCDVVQLVGGISAGSDASSAVDVLGRFARVAKGNLFSLDAPLVVSDAQTGERLREQQSINHTLSLVDGLAAAIVGIGSWIPAASQLLPMFRDDDIALARSRGATADVSAIIIDNEGREIGGDFTTRTIRAGSQDFLEIPRRIGVAIGAVKSDAVRAVLNGNWINVLVTDSTLATALLES